MNGASMILQQRAATRLLLLVCLLVLNCAAQPLARLALLDHAVSCQTLPQFASADDQADKGTPDMSLEESYEGANPINFPAPPAAPSPIACAV